MNSTRHSMQHSERFKQGLKKFMELDEEAGKQVANAFKSEKFLKEGSPDLVRYTTEYPFGDIYSRPNLDLKSREIATISALITLGFAEPQLKFHIKAGLNVGLSESEIREIIIQMSIYAGFPAAVNAMDIANEIFRREKRKTTKNK
jgi:4-carboxymuconolactone decarboxylase